MIDFAAVGEQVEHVKQHLAFKSSPAQLKRLAEEMQEEQIVRKRVDFVERESLVLWEEELCLHGKERETAVIDDDDDEGAVRI